MRKTLTVLVSHVLWATVFLPTSGAAAQDDLPPWEERPPTAAPFSQTCGALRTFEAGCLTSGGAWTEAFSTYAAGNGIETNRAVGARVQFFPQGSNPLDEVMYVVGPYLGATSDADDIDSIVAERAVLDDGVRGTEDLAPAMGPVRVRLRDLDVSILYISYGNFEDSQQPVSQRVAATKTAIRTFEAQRRAVLGRAPQSTALMGISLGGVVAKIAIRELENDNFKHGIATYLSFDSPHWGAYTPPGLQQIPLFMHDAFRWAETGFSWTEGLGGNDLDDARDGADRVTTMLLRSPVAQDLLIANLAYPGWQAPNNSYIRDRYYAMPRQTDRNVAIASGAIDGTLTPLGPRYFHFNTGNSSSKTGRMKISLDVRIPSIEAPSSFYGRLAYGPKWARSDKVREPVNLHAPMIENFERAPCAFSTDIVDSVVSQLNHQLSTSSWSGFSFSADENRACFIPTFSAVVGNYHPETGTPVGATAFDLVIGNGTNKEHLATSGQMNNEILSELDRVFAGGPSAAINPKPASPLTPPAEADSDADSGIGSGPDQSSVPPSVGGGYDQGESGLVGSSHPAPAPAPSGDCDFESGTHNLEDTRAMFPAKCGTAWHPERHTCDYNDDGWRCYNSKP